MSAPQRNNPYPYNPHLARAALFNRNDPHFASLISNFGSDGGDEDEALPRILPPPGHWNQEAQGTNTANNSELDAAAGDQNTLPTPPVESASVPGDGAGPEVANQTLTDDVVGTTAQPSTTAAHPAPASEPTGEAGADMNVPQEAISLRPLPSESQPEAGPSGGTSTSHTGHTSPIADMPSPANVSDTAQETASATTSISATTTSDDSLSRRGRKGAATPGGQPRRSIRECARRTVQALRDLLAPKSRGGRRSSTAANSGGPSTSINHNQSASPPVQDAAPTFNKGTCNNLGEDAKGAETGLSAKALGKRRRAEPDDDDEEARDSEDGSPSKKARRVKNLRNRSTPARFDVPREEPASPNPFLATPLRKRALDEDEENEAGASKRGRIDLDGEPLGTPRTPRPGPARTSPAMEQPRRSWSVQAQPSLPIVHIPQDSTGVPAPTALNTPLPEFFMVLPEMPPQPLGPAPPPVPAQPGPLVRTYAKIFVRARPSGQ